MRGSSARGVGPLCICKHGERWHKGRSRIAHEADCYSSERYKCGYYIWTVGATAKQYTCDCPFFAATNLEFMEKKYQMSLPKSGIQEHKPKHTYEHSMWCKLKSWVNENY